LPRKPWPDDVRAKILIRSKRICAFCFYFDDRSVKTRGQIAHVDRDPTNSEIDNGAYLCKNHHDEYDMKSSQSQRLTPAELKEARANVYEFLESGGLPASQKKLPRPKQSKPRPVSLAVYERRLPIYKATIEFLRYVVGDLKPEYPKIIQFGRDTEEALFLFDEEVAQYLRELSNRSVRLHAVVKMREAAVTYNRTTGNFESWIAQETSLVEWFTDQDDEIRRRFAPFLRLE
jgi:hypothetical protein